MANKRKTTEKTAAEAVTYKAGKKVREALQNQPVRSRVPKKMALINDLSGYGRCSLAVEIPVISAMRIQACPVPTAILSNHTGFPSEYKYDFTEQMRPYTKAWEQLKLSFDGIMTGYMNSEEQVKAAADFIDKFKKKNTVVFVDPAMADHGKLYRGFTPEYAEYIKENLIKRATIIKPNITEACILTGYDYEEIRELSKERVLRRMKSTVMNMVRELQELGPKQVIITGIERKDRIFNVVADGDDIVFISARKTGAYRGGTGDIFSSIVAASVVRGRSMMEAVKKATNFVATAIALTEAAGVPVREGVLFENIMDKLASTEFDF